MEIRGSVNMDISGSVNSIVEKPKKKCPANVGDIVHFVDKDLYCAAAIVIAINKDEQAGLMILAPGGFIPVPPGTALYSPISEDLEKNTWHNRSGCECKRIPTEIVGNRIRLQ